MEPVNLSSGALPATKIHSPPPLIQSNSTAMPKTPVQQSSTKAASRSAFVYAVPSIFLLLILLTVVLCICRNQGGKTIIPWENDFSGQLQNPFVSGIPKLNRAELEAACENFSIVLDTFFDCVIYRGKLSNGIEIAVASTSITSSKNWSEHAEMAFRKRIDTLSRINHENFVNLLGYCQEDQPFQRMLVFEYVPNGTLYQHLHVKEEHLDWNARMRIIMGMAYCLQHMHHDLNPPAVHPDLQSNTILLTDDFAAKIAEINFWIEIAAKSKIHDEEEVEHSNLHSHTSPVANVYSFGIVLLEIISGKNPYSQEQGSLVNWADEYLKDRRRISCMIDPKLKSFEKKELDIICEVILECINPDPTQRPNMVETAFKLREVTAISPDAAAPEQSPQWGAELQILSLDAS